MVVAAAELAVRAAVGGEMLLRVVVVVVELLTLLVLAAPLARSLEPDGGVAPVWRAVLAKEEERVEVKVLLPVVVVLAEPEWSVPASTQRTASATSQLLFLMISEAVVVGGR